MNINLQLVSLLFILIILIFIVYILRKGRITVKYSLIWIFAAVVLLLLLLFPGLLVGLTKILGFSVGSNMVFAGLIAMLMFINLSLTIIISGQSNKIRLLIQEVSMLKEKIK